MRTISLPQFQFDGPLDLLLALIRQNQYDIQHLPVSEVTRQFLAYLEAAERFDLDLDSEWFYMAATLIQIKSRSLLPADPAVDESDPRQELVRQLLDRKQLAGAAGFLETQWAALGGWLPPPPPAAAHKGEDNPAAHGSLTLLEVLELAEKALASVAAAAAARNLEIPPAAVPIEEMLALLDGHLAAVTNDSWMDFSTLWAAAPSDQHRSALFLALLEALRSRRLELAQEECFAPIWIRLPQPI